MIKPPASARNAAKFGLLAMATLGFAANAHATTWVPTATAAIPFAYLATGATDLGVLPPTQPLTVRVGLQMQNKAALLAFVTAATTPGNPSYGQFLKPGAFARGYAPSIVQIDELVGYLRKAGFTNIVVEPNHLIVSADGTAAMAVSAFNTSLEQVSIGGSKYFINTTAAQVPTKFGGLVAAVLGLNTVGKMASTIALPSPPQYLVSYTPKQFQLIYSANKVRPAYAATIAIMAEGNLTGVLSDLRIAEQAFALPQVAVEVVPVGVASSDVSGADEWDLDTQYSSGMAEKLRKLYLYDTTSLSDSDLALEFSRWATDNKAKAASASLGECEAFPYIDGSMVVDDMIFLEAASQGQTFFASSGDTGSFCPLGPVGLNGVPAGAPLVNYPAASPYVTGVGGTTLLTNSDGTTLLTNSDGTYNSEIAWNTGGGGVSLFEGSPGWQAAAVPLLATANMRGVPDVAMDADPNSGATVYVNGVAETVGGTSLSSPLALGVWARAISINPALGYAPPHIYSLYDGTGGAGGATGSYPEGGFNDIILGNNGAYDATPGYDLTTGLGTFIVNQFTQDLAP